MSRAAPSTTRAFVLVLATVLVFSGVAVTAVGQEANVQPAAQCGFEGGDPDPTVETLRHDFGEVVVGRTGERTLSPGDRPDGARTGLVFAGPDAGQFRVRPSEADSARVASRTVSFTPTTPGTKRAWAVVDAGGRTVVHCLVGTAVVAGAGRSGGGAGGGARADGADADGVVADAPGTGAGGGKVTDAVRGFGREFVGSVTRGVVSVVTLEFARDAAVGAGAAWAAGEGLGGKALNLVGYALSGIDPTAGLRNGLPAALAAWRAGDFEGAGRALFGVVESVVFTGAAAAGAWEGSKRARQFTRERREESGRQSRPGRDETPSIADYREFTTGLDAALSAGVERERGRDAGGGSDWSGTGPESDRDPVGTTPGGPATSGSPSETGDATGRTDRDDADDRRELA